MFPDFFEFFFPVQAVYAAGILKKPGLVNLASVCSGAVLITDRENQENGNLEMVKKALDAFGIEIISTCMDVPDEPTTETVEECIYPFLSRKDGQLPGIIALGGKPVQDVSKGAALRLSGISDIAENCGAFVCENPVPPLVFIPANPADAADFNMFASIWDHKTKEELFFAENHFLPGLVILDPELLHAQTGRETGENAVCALSRAVETLTGTRFSPADHAMALKAVSFITTYILKAIAEPDDLRAKGALLLGGFLAGASVCRSPGSGIRSLSHSMSSHLGVKSKLASALLLPELMEEIVDGNSRSISQVAIAMGISSPRWQTRQQGMLKSASLRQITESESPLDVIGMWLGAKTHNTRETVIKTISQITSMDTWMSRQAAWAAVDRIRTLNRQISYLSKMPLNLEKAGINLTANQIKAIVSAFYASPCTRNGAHSLSRKAIERILKRIHTHPKTPLPVSMDEIENTKGWYSLTNGGNLFPDRETVFRVIGGFLKETIRDPEIASILNRHGLCLQFVFEHPDCIITVDPKTQNIRMHTASDPDEGIKTDAAIFFSADVAHRILTQTITDQNLVSAGIIRIRGNLAPLGRLFRELRYAATRYPRYLNQSGLDQFLAG